MSDLVQRALDHVDEDMFTRREDGRLVTQSTAPEAVADELRTLDVPPGARVLEIGTGSGFSTALLATIVGVDGHVVSLDVDPELIARASELFERARIKGRVTPLTRDGLYGAAEYAPYQRIIAWTTPSHLPATWTQQAVPGSVVVTPVDIAPLARMARGILRVRVEDNQVPRAENISRGGYVDMCPEVLTQWTLPARLVDAMHSDSGRVWWLSAPWLRQEGPAARGQALDVLKNAQLRTATGELLRRDEDLDGFTAWLLATFPPGITTAGIEDARPLIGITTPESVALLSHGGQADVGATAARQLSEHIEEWREAGCPGWCQLRPRLIPRVDGWDVRVAISSGETTVLPKMDASRER